MQQEHQQLFNSSVLEQQALIPEIYGSVDFGQLPERYVRDFDLETLRPSRHRNYCERVLDNPELVERIRNYTMMGDKVADAYASLIPEYGFRALVSMLEQACDEGIESVENAPDELVAFISAMEATPDWVDMAMVEEGAKHERIPLGTISPFAIRGAFIATFMNKYTALPMTMTGTLTDQQSVRRVFETASFFTATTMPRAMERFNPGFKAAAKVRLMHSMVRFNIMRTGKWDVSTYGIPIPQVDQMPAGLIGIFLLSYKLLAQGRTDFTPAERARVEMARYRCFLLGLPEELLGETPQEIVDLMTARDMSLHKIYDDETCGELVRGTMDAELFTDPSITGRFHRWMERGFSKYFLIQNFCEGKSSRAAAMGVHFTLNDKIATICALATIVSNSNLCALGMKIPGVRNWLDRRLTRKLGSLLETYGHADFITDASEYKLVGATQSPSASA